MLVLLFVVVTGSAASSGGVADCAAGTLGEVVIVGDLDTVGTGGACNDVGAGVVFLSTVTAAGATGAGGATALITASVGGLSCEKTDPVTNNNITTVSNTARSENFFMREILVTKNEKTNTQ